jgi:hypothetical protein
MQAAAPSHFQNQSQPALSIATNFSLQADLCGSNGEVHVSECLGYTKIDTFSSLFDKFGADLGVKELVVRVFYKEDEEKGVGFSGIDNVFSSVGDGGSVFKVQFSARVKERRFKM